MIVTRMRPAVFAALGLGAVIATSPALAGVTGVTTLAGIGVADSIDWKQLSVPGFPSATLDQSAIVMSAGGKSATVSTPDVLVVCGSSCFGGFQAGEWTIDTRSYPLLDVTFDTPVRAVGAQFDNASASAQPFVVKIVAINGAALGSFTEDGVPINGARLGSFTEDGETNNSGIQDGSNIFIGIKSTAADISSIRFEATIPPQDFRRPTGPFAVGALYFNSDVPEPATWALMLVGVGGVGASVRGRRRRAVATPA